MVPPSVSCFAMWYMPIKAMGKTTGNKAMLAGKESLDKIAARVDKNNINPQPKSGMQERLENLVNSYC